jgi:drug/metabolite transporter (DMT)-like permease
MEFISQFRGEVAALTAALIWACATFIFLKLGKQLPPMSLNLAKSGIAIVLTVLAILLLGDRTISADIRGIGFLFVSGAIGIAFGDTAFFEALKCLGSRRALLMESLAPPLTALLALVVLQEVLTATAWLGIGLTIVGVSWVVVERTPDVAQQYLQPMRGIIFGLMAALGQAGGAVITRSVLVDTDMSTLWSTLIRLIGGVVVLFLWRSIRRQPWQGLETLRTPRFLGILVATSFMSTFLAIWLQQTSLKYAAAGVAQSLSATSPLFALVIGLLLGETVTVRAFLGVIVALGGIWLLFGQG